MACGACLCAVRYPTGRRDDSAFRIRCETQAGRQPVCLSAIAEVDAVGELVGVAASLGDGGEMARKGLTDRVDGLHHALREAILAEARADARRDLRPEGV